MNRIAKAAGFVFTIATLSLVFAVHAPAQTHNAGAAGSLHSGSVRSGGARSAGRIATPLQPNFAPLRTVPGLSFDVRSLAAASRPGFGHRRGQYVTPFLWYSPYYSPYVDYGYDVEPPYAVPPTRQTGPAPLPAEAVPSEEAPFSADLRPPPPDVGQLILVRLDGQVLFASAFMAVEGRIAYVTREGVRRSFPISELDKDATRQMNEANGTSVSLPD